MLIPESHHTESPNVDCRGYHGRRIAITSIPFCQLRTPAVARAPDTTTTRTVKESFTDFGKGPRKMVYVQCDHDDSCEIKLRASGSIDIDCHQSLPQGQPDGLAMHEPDFRDQHPNSLRSLGSDNRSEPSDDDVERFLSDLGDPKDCRKLTLVRQGSKYHTSSDCHYVRNPFPVATLNYVLQRAKNLACLELCRIRLVGSTEEFANLARAIESLSFLQVFSLEYCRLSKSTAKQCALEPVVRALASCTSISDVTLMADKPQSLGTLSPHTVAFLGRSPSLQILRLGKLELQDAHIAELSQALENNAMLHTLRLSCTVSDRGAGAIAKMLGSNSSIQAFDLFLEQVKNEQSTLRIAGALQTSAFLKHYGLDFGSKNLSSRLKQVHKEVIETKALARELEFSSTRLSNCPFIRLLNGAIDASMYIGRIACGPGDDGSTTKDL